MRRFVADAGGGIKRGWDENVHGSVGTVNSPASRDVTDADRTLRGLRHIGSAQLLTQLINWGFTAITIRLLQPRDYGLIATSGIVTALAQLLMDGGLTEVLIAQQELSEAIQGAALSAVLFISVVLGAVIFAISPVFSSFFHSPPLHRILQVSAFYFPLSALEVVPKALLSKRMSFGKIAVASTAGSIVQGASTVAMAYVGAAYWALIVGSFVGSTIRISLLWLNLSTKPVPNADIDILRPLFRNSGQMMGMRLIWYLIDNFDLFLLGRFAGTTALGAYSVARTLSYSAMNQIGSIVNQVALPAFAGKTSRESQVAGLLSAISISAVLFFPLFWMMGAVSPIALPLVFSGRWGTLIVPFVAFTVILPLRSINTLFYAALLGTGRTGATLQVTLGWAAIGLPLMMLGVIEGADGVALSWAVGFPIVFYLVLSRISSVFSVGVSTLFRPMLPPAACAVSSVLMSEAVAHFLQGHFTEHAPANIANGLVAACQCISGAVCYWYSLRLFGKEQHASTLAMMRRLVGA